MTQTERIEKHLRAGNTINPLQALNNFGCFRLGARVYDLRGKGLNIVTTIDKKRHFATYRLVK